MAGLLHDLGKYTPEFQARLRGDTTSVDHSTAGAAEILRLTSGLDNMIGQLIAYAIAGHHAGLPDRIGETGSLDARLWRNIDPSASIPFGGGRSRRTRMASCPADFAEPRPKSTEELAFRLSVLGRMIFSCLVDADFRDTEAFYDAIKGAKADRAWPASGRHPAGAHRPLRRAYGDKCAKPDSAVNRLRGEILAHVRAKAGEAPGFFTLTVPRAAARRWRRSASRSIMPAAHGHSRIIYAIPFTSIIDQTAAIFRDVLGEDNVLEHHSAIDEEKHRGPRVARQAAAGHGGLGGAGRRHHQRAVVREPVRQPPSAVPQAAQYRGQRHHSRRGADHSARAARALAFRCWPNWCAAMAAPSCCAPRRSRRWTRAISQIRRPSPCRWRGANWRPIRRAWRASSSASRCVTPATWRTPIWSRRCAAKPQGLVIVNSRRHALELYAEAKAAGLAGLVHLTTRQHAADRREILADVRGRLKAARPAG